MSIKVKRKQKTETENMKQILSEEKIVSFTSTNEFSEGFIFNYIFCLNKLVIGLNLCFRCKKYIFHYALDVNNL